MPFAVAVLRFRAVNVLPYHNFAGSKYEALGMENTLPKKLPTEEEIATAQAKFNK